MSWRSVIDILCCAIMALMCRWNTGTLLRTRDVTNALCLRQSWDKLPFVCCSEGIKFKREVFQFKYHIDWKVLPKAVLSFTALCRPFKHFYLKLLPEAYLSPTILCHSFRYLYFNCYPKMPCPALLCVVHLWKYTFPGGLTPEQMTERLNLV